MSDEEFDLLEHRRRRNQLLASENVWLRGEVERLWRLLGALLQVSARSSNCDPRLLLEACCSIIMTDPSKAHINQRHEFVAWLEIEDLQPPGTYEQGE